MQKTRREILDDFLRWKGQLGDANARLLASDLLNRSVLAIWMAHPWRSFRLPSPIQVTTVADQRTYALPQYFGRLPPQTKTIRNLTTGRNISLFEQAWLEDQYPEMGTTLESAGVPRLAFLGAPVGISTQPSTSGDALEVLSSSASDTAIRVLVEGINSDGEWDETQVTLTGTTAVAIGTWTSVSTFSKAYPNGTTPTTVGTSSVGSVTVRKVTGATILQTLLPEESAREFPALTVFPKPTTASEILAIPALRAPKRMLYDADECPRFWENALLEEMNIQLGVSNGDIADGSQVPRPELVKLIMQDNSILQMRPIRVRPFIGV